MKWILAGFIGIGFIISGLPASATPSEVLAQAPDPPAENPESPVPDPRVAVALADLDSELLEMIFQAQSEDDPQAAIATYSAVLTQEPNIAEVYLFRAGLLFQQNILPDAIDDWTEALALNPNLVEAYNNRGVAYYQQERYQPALDDFNQVIELNPSATAYYNRALIHLKTENHVEAIADASSAINANPEFAEVLQVRGIARYYAEETASGALEDLNKAIELNEDLASAYQNRGYIRVNIEADPAGGLQDLSTSGTRFLDQGNFEIYQQIQDQTKLYQPNEESAN